MPKKTVSASEPRYPAKTRRSWSLPSSRDGFGAACPRRLSVLSRRSLRTAGAPGSRSDTPSSPSRRSMAFSPRSSDIPIAAISREMNRNPTRGSRNVTLHLDLDDLTDPDEPDRLHDDGAHHHHLPHPDREERPHVVGADEHQRDGQECRKSEQHIAGEPAMRGVDAHLAQNLEALSHDIGEVVQDLSEITAGLALDLDRRHEELHVHERHAHGEVVERLLQRQAEVLLLETLLELDSHRRRQLVGHHAQRALERVAGANRARQQVQRFGELLLELAQAAAALDLQPHDRRRQAHERRHERRQPEAREQQGQKAQPAHAPRLIVITVPGLIATPDCSIRLASHEPAPVPPTRRSTTGNALDRASLSTTLVAGPSSLSKFDRSLRRCSNSRSTLCSGRCTNA